MPRTQCRHPGPQGRARVRTGRHRALRRATRSSKNDGRLLHYGYRFYNPSTGRWLNRDPGEEHSFAVLHIAQRLLPHASGAEYRFAANRPLALFDILGLICCDSSEIARQRQYLTARYIAGAQSLKSRYVPHYGEGDWSCYNINFNVLLYLQQGCQRCWDCKLEHRSRFRLIGTDWYDHWAVVCKSRDHSQQMLFDYWHDRPAGEDPEVWFRKVYNALGGYNSSTEEFEDPYRNGEPCSRFPGNPLHGIPSGYPPPDWPNPL